MLALFLARFAQLVAIANPEIQVQTQCPNGTYIRLKCDNKLTQENTAQEPRQPTILLGSLISFPYTNERQSAHEVYKGIKAAASINYSVPFLTSNKEHNLNFVLFLSESLSGKLNSNKAI